MAAPYQPGGIGPTARVRQAKGLRRAAIKAPAHGTFVPKVAATPSHGGAAKAGATTISAPVAA